MRSLRTYSDRIALSGNIQSLLDLAQSTLLLSIDNDQRYLGAFSGQFKKSVELITVKSIHLKINGRKLKITNLQSDRREPYDISYRYQFPKELRQLNDGLYEFN